VEASGLFYEDVLSGAFRGWPDSLILSPCFDSLPLWQSTSYGPKHNTESEDN
jgi:hypothetical protein